MFRVAFKQLDHVRLQSTRTVLWVPGALQELLNARAAQECERPSKSQRRVAQTSQQNHDCNPLSRKMSGPTIGQNTNPENGCGSALRRVIAVARFAALPRWGGGVRTVQ